MRIAIGADHRGWALKNALVQWLAAQGHEVTDEGTRDPQSVDYPDYAQKVALKVARGEAERGLLICATGVGMAIAANKVHGIRATTCSDETTARLCRQHNDVNVLCLPGDHLDAPTAERIVAVWLATPFEGGRHARRLDKVAQIERQSCSGSSGGTPA
jgi:ribose 5-phosphate isomerase B